MGGKRKTPAEVAVKSGEENEKGCASGGKVDDKVILTPTQKAVFWKIIGEGHGGKVCDNIQITLMGRGPSPPS